MYDLKQSVAQPAVNQGWRDVGDSVPTCWIPFDSESWDVFTRFSEPERETLNNNH
jgi:hypothetical protein